MFDISTFKSSDPKSFKIFYTLGMIVDPFSFPFKFRSNGVGWMFVLLMSDKISCSYLDRVVLIPFLLG